MSITDSLTACEIAVRTHDPDRYFSALFAPAEKRSLLFALYAFNHELARIGETVREPMMGEIRLQWWRETVESTREGNPRAHDVSRALFELFRKVELPVVLFEAMMDARAFDFSPEPFADDAARDEYLDATSGNLMRLAARVLGAGDAYDELAREAGIAYGLAGLIRSQAAHGSRGKLFLRDPAAAANEARARLIRARRIPQPRATLAAFLPATLVPLYLRRAGLDVPLYRRQFALLSAALRLRI
jgi:phytoene/squalene synthetase